MASAPVAKTPHFVLYRMAVASCAASITVGDGQACESADPTAGIHTNRLPVPDFEEARQAFRVCGAAKLRSTDHVWWAALVPKRWAKLAVTRNLVRRQIAACLLDQLGSGLLSTPAQFEAVAYFIRMRSSFHAHSPAKSGQGKAKSKVGQHPRQTPQAVQQFSSAASPQLKAQVRQELLSLFQRASANANPRMDSV